ncbi:unannotated protein [freshwater metagenome]|uniref:Unannotated protein n=1 Tax=freshwater metagenome TaxID=449393 RepID=A0A6J6R345_9ZZZZ
MQGHRGGSRRARRGTHRLRQDDHRRVRHPPGARHGAQGLLHDPHQGPVEPEVPRSRAALRPRPGGTAHRRQRRQRRGTRGRDDHRGPAQHALRRVPDAAGTGLRRDGRGALPRRPVPRRGLGGGDHPPAGLGVGGLALRDGLQRGGVRRVARDRPGRHHHDRGGEAAGAALPARDRRAPVARPLRLLRRRRRRGVRQGGRPGQRRAGQARARRLGSDPPQGPPLAARTLQAGRRTQAGGQRAPRLDPEPLGGHRAARPLAAAAGHRVHLQPGRLRRRRHPVPQRRHPAHLARGARPDLRLRRGELSPPARGRPPRAGLPRLPRRPHPRRRRPPRRDAARLQAVCGGALSPGTVQGGLRDRDAGPRHQHAGPHRGHREALEVERRDARRHHPGGVHPAHRARRPPRPRHRGPRRRALAARHGPARGRRPRLDAHVSVALVVPTVVQHGRQPRAPVRSGPGPRAARAVVRAVPGRQGRRRSGPAAAQEPRRPRRLRRGRAVRPRGLHGVRRPAPEDQRCREGREPLQARRPSPGGDRLAEGAQARRRDPGADRQVRRLRRRHRSRLVARGTAPLRRDGGPPSAAPGDDRLPGAGGGADPDQGAQELQRPRPPDAPRPRGSAAITDPRPDPAARFAPRGRVGRARRVGRPGAGAARRAARAPLPRLPRSRGPLALGRALAQARPRREDPAAAGRAAHQHGRPAVRPGV